MFLRTAKAKAPISSPDVLTPLRHHPEKSRTNGIVDDPMVDYLSGDHARRTAPEAASMEVNMEARSGSGHTDHT